MAGVGRRGSSLVVVVFVAAPLLGRADRTRASCAGLEGATEVVKIVVHGQPPARARRCSRSGSGRPTSPGRSRRLFADESVKLAGVIVPYHRIIILIAAGLVAIVLRLVLYRSRAGIAMRAVVDDRNLVRLNGARPGRVSMLAWAIGASLAALSGVLVAALQNVDAVTLTLLVVNCYAAAVVGKLRSLPLTFLGALILGLGESYCAAYLTGSTSVAGYSLSGFQFALPAIMLFVVMVMQPQARLRAGGVQRVRESWRVPSMRNALFGAVAIVVVGLRHHRPDRRRPRSTSGGQRDVLRHRGPVARAAHGLRRSDLAGTDELRRTGRRRDDEDRRGRRHVGRSHRRAGRVRSRRRARRAARHCDSPASTSRWPPRRSASSCRRWCSRRTSSSAVAPYAFPASTSGCSRPTTNQAAGGHARGRVRCARRRSSCGCGAAPTAVDSSP